MRLMSICCIVTIVLICGSCFKPKNELPNTNGNYDPSLLVNCTLIKLNALNPTEGTPMLIDSDWTIAVIVSADDKTANFSNQLVVQDSTGGMALMLNSNSLYMSFPIGRKLYIHLKGLYLGNNHGNPELGATPAMDNDGVLQVSDIQAKEISKHIIGATMQNSLIPIEVNLEDLKTPKKDLLNRLVSFPELELVNPNYDNVYADPTATTSILLQNCSGTKISLRTSNYATFQGFTTPWGKGRINGIYTIYNGAAQLTIRDTTDVKMTAIRCDGTSRGAPVPISIDSVRKMYKGYDTVIGNFSFNGVVTSDAINKNFGTGNVIVQNANKGIIVYFGLSGIGLPDLGDSVTIDISGATLTKYAGALELKNIKPSKVNILAKNRYPAPITITIAALNANFSFYESVLVKIFNAKIAKAGNFSGSNTLSDATGNIILFTNSTATFANDAVQTISKTYQGIVTPYNTTNEIKIRNTTLDIY